VVGSDVVSGGPAVTPTPYRLIDAIARACLAVRAAVRLEKVDG
jgi:hypothetical protein